MGTHLVNDNEQASLTRQMTKYVNLPIMVQSMWQQRLTWASSAAAAAVAAAATLNPKISRQSSSSLFMMASLAVDVYVMTRHVVAFIHVSAVHPCVAHVPYTLLSGTCLYRVIMCYRTAVLGRANSPDAWFKFVVFSILGQNSDSHNLYLLRPIRMPDSQTPCRCTCRRTDHWWRRSVFNIDFPKIVNTRHYLLRIFFF